MLSTKQYDLQKFIDKLFEGMLTLWLLDDL